MQSNTSMLIDKYRPDTFDDLDFNQDTNRSLIELSKADNIPHIIFEGRRGSGKKTRINAFLKQKFGELTIKNQYMEFKVSSNKKKIVNLHVKYSRYHYQFNPSIHGVFDRSILNQFINNIVPYQKLSSFPYRIIVVEDADNLTTEAQSSLRRTLETRISRCRFIFLVNKENNVTDQLYSRCLTIKNASPTEDQIFAILQNILKKEVAGGSKIASITSDETLKDIVSHSQRNLDIAMQYLHKVLVLKLSSFNLPKIDARYVHVYTIVDLLVSGKNLDIVKDIREQTYILLVNGILPTNILKMVFNNILEKIPKIKSNFRTINNICRIASERDDSLRLGGKALYHLESFFLHVFQEIKLLMLSKTSKSPSPTQLPLSPSHSPSPSPSPSPPPPPPSITKKKMILKKRTSDQKIK